ncbi:hypothetical protein ABZX95_41405 [Streptomyces sp. NPDC004232]|uniref:hypothetical protein n=1 Tax=unclassified Streptomyces TaxID=2593676 RepID=UPI001D7B62D3|nr:hypothetical protein [Streptomyces sp. tea 10]
MNTDDPRVGAYALAEQWATLPPEHLKAALKSADAELARQHEHRMARVKASTDAARRAHVLHLSGVIAAFLISGGMIAGAIISAQLGHEALSYVLVGPTCLALASLFVLRKQPQGVQETTRLSLSALNASPNQPSGPSGAGIV